MNQYLVWMLACGAVTSTAHATDNGWAGLDQEISSLTATLQTTNPTTPKLGGYIVAALDYQGDPAVFDDANDDGAIDPGETTEGDDTLGWSFRYVRLQATGDLGHDYSYKVSFELGGGTGSLRDAHADWKVTDGVSMRWGRYKVPFARSALVSDTKLLFLQRTRIADMNGVRDLGTMLTGQFDKLTVILNAQNGADGPTDELLYNARATFGLIGDGVGMVEGAYGAGDSAGLSVGGAIGDYSGVDDGVRWIFDAAFTAGQFALFGEVAGYGEDIGDSTPWDLTASFLFAEVWEVAARYEDYDADDSPTGDTSYSVGLNRYIAGHDIKWQLQYQRVDTDFESDGVGYDRDVVSLGLVVAF